MSLIVALQLKISSDQVQRLAEQRFQNSGALENTQKRLLDVRRSSQQAQESLEESQSKVERSRGALLELQIELERERYNFRFTHSDLFLGFDSSSGFLQV